MKVVIFGLFASTMLRYPLVNSALSRCIVAVADALFNKNRQILLRGEI